MGPKRRLRVRRKRRDGSLVGDFPSSGLDDVILETGCCLVEAVISAGLVLLLVGLPAYFALR
jgi:hypothetical protein